MGKKNKRNQLLSRSLKDKADKKGLKRDPKVVFSLIDLDVNQGQTIQDWEEIGLAGQLLDKLRAISTMTKQEAQQQQVIKPYPKVSFPPKSDFSHPKHIPENITWCSMHLQGKECIIGYFDENVFRIVFLDKDHRFWITEKK